MTVTLNGSNIPNAGSVGYGNGVEVAFTNPGTAGAFLVSNGSAAPTFSTTPVDGTDPVGFRNIPINSQSAGYITVLSDSGKIIFHPSTDPNARTYTIPSNASVPYPLGTALTFINMTSQVVTISINSDTMYLGTAGSTGARQLAYCGSATAIKMTDTTWLISGGGLT